MHLGLTARLGGLALLVILAVPAAAQERIDWREDFESSLEEAVILRRPLLVTFYTDWCGWCRKLEAQTFRDPEFVDMAGRYVPVRLDGDRARGLAAMFRVSSYPTTILLSRQGRELRRIVGYKPPAPFTQALLAALGVREPYAEIRAAVEAAPEDPEALYALGDVYMALGRYDEARETFGAVLAADPGNTRGLADDAQLDLAVATYLGTGPRPALPEFDAFLEGYPDSERRDHGLYFSGLALRDAGRGQAADERLAEAARTTRLDYIREQAHRLMDSE